MASALIKYKLREQRKAEERRAARADSNHEWNEVADDLAKRGCGGRRYVGPPMVD